MTFEGFELLKVRARLLHGWLSSRRRCRQRDGDIVAEVVYHCTHSNDGIAMIRWRCFVFGEFMCLSQVTGGMCKRMPSQSQLNGNGERLWLRYDTLRKNSPYDTCLSVCRFGLGSGRIRLGREGLGEILLCPSPNEKKANVLLRYGTKGCP